MTHSGQRPILSDNALQKWSLWHRNGLQDQPPCVSKKNSSNCSKIEKSVWEGNWVGLQERETEFLFFSVEILKTGVHEPQREFTQDFPQFPDSRTQFLSKTLIFLRIATQRIWRMPNTLILEGLEKNPNNTGEIAEAMMWLAAVTCLAGSNLLCFWFQMRKRQPA